MAVKSKSTQARPSTAKPSQKPAQKPAAKKPSQPKGTEVRSEQIGAVHPVRPAAVPVVRVDSGNRRSDKDALEGHFVNVVSGEHTGLRGVFREVASVEKDGYPKTILVRARDHAGDQNLVVVNYADVRPDGYREPKDK